MVLPNNKPPSHLFVTFSRSLFASFIPAGRNAEFFAFYTLSSKFSGRFGPLIYGGLLLFTGATRIAMLSPSVFFALGRLPLYFVNVEQGRVEASRLS